MLGTMLAEEGETPELLALFRERLVAPRRRELRAVLEAARDRGDLRGDANLEVAVNALVGACFARYLAGELVRRALRRPRWWTPSSTGCSAR